jgi:nucleotide-binding universal stress UspA family protein
MPPPPILLATDGSPETEALCAAAHFVASRWNAPVEVLAVCEPTPLAPAVGGGVVSAPEIDAIRQQTKREDVRRAIALSVRGDASWPIDVPIGTPSDMVARTACERDAQLVIMGIGRHNPLDRLLGTETTLATIRKSCTPILAVGSTFAGQLQHAVVGMDFSTASVHAAQLVLSLLGTGGTLTLVHVRPALDHPRADWAAWDQSYGASLTPLFADVVAALQPPSQLSVHTVSVRGDPAPALLAYAQQHHADLIGVGTQRTGILDRLLVGSVATRVLRNARITTLAVPATIVASENAEVDVAPGIRAKIGKHGA